MSFKVFSRKINKLARKSNTSIATFEKDGRHVGISTDGVIFLGNSKSGKVCVRWGSNHCAMAAL